MNLDFNLMHIQSYDKSERRVNRSFLNFLPTTCLCLVLLREWVLYTVCVHCFTRCTYIFGTGLYLLTFSVFVDFGNFDGSFKVTRFFNRRWTIDFNKTPIVVLYTPQNIRLCNRNPDRVLSFVEDCLIQRLLCN